MLVEREDVTVEGGSGACSAVQHDLYLYLVPQDQDFPPDFQSFADVSEEAGNAVSVGPDGSVSSIDLPWYLEQLETYQIGSIDLGSISTYDVNPFPNGGGLATFDERTRDVVISANSDLTGLTLQASVEGRIASSPDPLDLTDPILPTTDPELEADTVLLVEDVENGNRNIHTYFSGNGTFQGASGASTIVTQHSPGLEGALTIDMGNGDDTAVLGDGFVGSIDGGAGDDLISVAGSYDGALPAVNVVGGDGADMLDIGLSTSMGTAGDAPVVLVADFDPDEDVLRFTYDADGPGQFQSLDIVEAADGSYSDVILSFSQDHSTELAVSVVRLEGVTGLAETDFSVLDKHTA